MADYMAANKGYIKAFLSFHSYSQLILYPWSYTSSASPDEQLLHEIAEVTAAGIKSVHGTEYTPQASNALCKLAANNKIGPFNEHSHSLQIPTMERLLIGLMETRESSCPTRLSSATQVASAFFYQLTRSFRMLKRQQQVFMRLLWRQLCETYWKLSN